MADRWTGTIHAEMDEVRVGHLHHQLLVVESDLTPIRDLHLERHHDAEHQLLEVHLEGEGGALAIVPTAATVAAEVGLERQARLDMVGDDEFLRV